MVEKIYLMTINMKRDSCSPMFVIYKGRFKQMADTARMMLKSDPLFYISEKEISEEQFAELEKKLINLK